MYVVRVLRNKPFKNYICTSSVLKCEKFNKLEVSKEKRENAVQTPKLANSFNKKSKKKTKRTNQEKESQLDARIKFDPFKNTAKSLAKNVAKQLGGNEKKTADDLLDYLNTFDLKNDRFKNRQDKITYDMLDVDFQNFGYQKLINIALRNKRQEIFKSSIMKETKNEIKLKIWHELEAEELAFRSKCPPRNYFEELISWTEEGKLWHFPIDNDQGMEEDAKIDFSEHIFMEKYLEPWCPQRGPLRKFMELVLTGLSKNPYLTVEEKKSHIDWFRKYFEDKKKLLQELGAIGSFKEIEVPKQEESS